MPVDSTNPGLRRIHRARTERALAGFFDLQAETLRPQFEQGLVSFNVDRWNRDLAGVMFNRGKETATDFGNSVFALLGRSLRFDPDLMDGWLDVWSTRGAVNINAVVLNGIDDALIAEDPLGEFDGFFDGMTAVRAGLYAVSVTTTTGNFGAQDGARAGGAARKTWQSTTGHERHAGMSGETVGLDELFSNGLRWPGDPSGGAAEVANCECSLIFA